jgi:hypothetical protein
VIGFVQEVRSGGLQAAWGLTLMYSPGPLSLTVTGLSLPRIFNSPASTIVSCALDLAGPSASRLAVGLRKRPAGIYAYGRSIS